jgi:predicted GTPase
MGYSKSQLDDLAETIAAVDCDTVVIATPVDLARLIPLTKPACRVRYELEEISRPDLTDVAANFIRAHQERLPAR